MYLITRLSCSIEGNSICGGDGDGGGWVEWHTDCVHTYTSPLLRRLAAGVLRSSALDTLPLELPPHALSSLSDDWWWWTVAAAVPVTSVSVTCGVVVVLSLPPTVAVAMAAAADETMPSDDSSGWLMDIADSAIGLTDSDTGCAAYTVAVPLSAAAVNAGFSTPCWWPTLSPPPLAIADLLWFCNVPDRFGSISWIGDNTTCSTHAHTHTYIE